MWDYDWSSDRHDWSGRLRTIFGIGLDIDPSKDAIKACVRPADRANYTRALRGAHDADAPRFELTFRIHRANDGAERWIVFKGWRTYLNGGTHRRIIMTADALAGD